MIDVDGSPDKKDKKTGKILIRARYWKLSC